MEFESRPIQIPIFQEKVTHSYTNRPDFGPNSEKNHPICPKFSEILANFGSNWKNQPIHIPNFAFYKGSFIYQEADFATHVGGTFP